MATTKVLHADGRRLLAALMLMISPTLYSQSLQKEIDEQVWKPFTNAIMNHDADKFIAVHSKDVIRVERDSKKIMRYDEYKAGISSWPSWKKQMQESKTKYVFELRFLERIATSEVAHEVGYYKNETTTADGNTRKSYGKFNVVLQKENGTWKILLDSDTSEGKSITEEMFLAAAPIGQ